jgi:hypothetical protein
MASVEEPESPPLLTIASALEELEFKYTMPLDDIEPCIKFVSFKQNSTTFLQIVSAACYRRSNWIIKRGFCN